MLARGDVPEIESISKKTESKSMAIFFKKKNCLKENWENTRWQDLLISKYCRNKLKKRTKRQSYKLLGHASLHNWAKGERRGLRINREASPFPFPTWALSGRRLFLAPPHSPLLIYGGKYYGKEPLFIPY